MTGSEKSWPTCTQQQDTFFTIKWWLYTLTNNSAKYFYWKLPRLLLLWLVSEVCQTSSRAWMFFKWLHLPLTSRQPAVHDWLLSLDTDLAALCDMWRWKWNQGMSFSCFHCWYSLCLPLCGCSPAPTLPPYRSAGGIGYTIYSKNDLKWLAFQL